MSIIEFIENNIPMDEPIVTAIVLCIVFLICYDFYHMFFSAVLSWFRKK